MKRIDSAPVAEQLRTTQDRVRELEHELQVMHSKLNQLTTCRSWLFIDWFRRVKYWLFNAPTDKRREKMRHVIVSGLRKVGLYPLAARVWRRIGTTKPALPPEREVPAVDNDSCGYDVICLPVIAWNSRFQRPQQIARQQATEGHRVFYASLGFHRGNAAELSTCERNVREMSLPGTVGANVYQELPSEKDLRRMVSAIDELRRQWRITSAVVVVQLPFWTALAEKLREKFNWPIVYDCMDDHAGFSTNCDSMLRMEERTIAEADLVVVTSEVLKAKVAPRAQRTVLIRNACDYDHFAAVSTIAKGEGALLPPARTIGFYGAIAEWFDADLVADLALLKSDWRFELIGSTFTGDVSRLEKLSNLQLLGEKPYSELPQLVADWDAFIVPFKRLPLTEATNPVKAYEMLATGKPVVAVNLPELRPMARDGLVSLADDARGFVDAIERELAQDDDHRRLERRAFAANNTWHNRAESLDMEVRKLFPPASIIVVTYNNLHLNQGCLESIFHRTDWPNYELIVIDNASTDGTAEWLAEFAKNEGNTAPWRNLRVILNEENLGYAAANNQGLHAAGGEYLCLLNNDTVVSRGWLSTLTDHLRKMPRGGMAGPVSNMVGNEAKIPVGYTSIDDMPEWAANYCRRHDGESFPIKMLGFFCVLFDRKLYEKIGKLDEQFGVGYFEDTDYCYRVRQEGYELNGVRDAFVHHWQGASFRLLGDGTYADIYSGNQELFENKWGVESKVGMY